MTIDFTSDFKFPTATIWGEARGQSLLGKQGVAAVVNNRAQYAKTHHRPQFGDGTLRSACLASWQFSSWNPNDPNRSKMLSLDFSEPDEVLQDCIDTAQATIDGTLVDPTEGATFYFADGIPEPDWAKTMQFTVKIGAHSFFAEQESLVA